MREFNRKISVKEMQIVDENSTDYGIPKSFLMECAGLSAAQTVFEKFNLGLNSKNEVIIICGTGNNGGDGFVIARHLAARQVSVTVLLIGNPDDIRSEEARQNWKILSNLMFHLEIHIVRDSSYFINTGFQIPEGIISDPDLVIDCLLGTGVKGSIREPIKSAILFINGLKSKGKKIISIDVPSGMNPDSGIVEDISVEPNLVITFHRRKLGFKKSKFKIPEIVLKSIGIPEDADFFIGIGDAMSGLKKRDLFNYKGQHGKVLIIGGSERYSGAPALSALAAAAMDMDLVIVYAPNSVADVIRSYSPNLIVRSGKSDNICEQDIQEISELIRWADSCVIGPGIGLSQETKKAMGEILKILVQEKKPVVIDADAIKICSSYKVLLKNTEAILTPHTGEFYILTNTKLPDQSDFKERAKILELVALTFDATFLVKGRYDFISNSEQTRVNKTGVPGMAVGGTGDILTGIIAALLALGNNKFDAACIGAYLCGKLGEEFQNLYKDDQKGSIKTFQASDLVKIIPKLIAKFV